MTRVVGRTAITLVQGDIAVQRADALVNAANAALAGGGGVDGALHRGAGPELMAACQALPAVGPHVRCPPGEVRTTGAFRLPARFVIHAVGPIWDPSEPRHGDEVLLATWRAVFAEAQRVGARTVAAPSISTGAYRFPVPRAATLAVHACLEAARAAPGAFDTVTFVLFSVSDRETYARALREAP